MTDPAEARARVKAYLDDIHIEKPPTDDDLRALLGALEAYETIVIRYAPWEIEGRTQIKPPHTRYIDGGYEPTRCSCPAPRDHVGDLVHYEGTKTDD